VLQTDGDVARHSAEIARLLHGEPTVELTAQAVVDLAVTLVDGCDAAGLSLVRRGQVVTVAHRGDAVLRGDAWQYELGEGPCLDAMAAHQAEVESADLISDPRWPRWGPRVVHELGVRSMLSFRLFTASSLVGALNLYAFTPEAFSRADHFEGHVLASQAALALAATEKVENLEIAVARRTTIGQAQGILMERFQLSSSQAFDVLVRLSRDGNRKLYDIAETVVRTRSLPALGPAATPVAADTAVESRHPQPSASS
jgi:GAF domain-containing protein